MITIFEKFWTEKELKIPKLNDHLTLFFKNLDIDYSLPFSAIFSLTTDGDKRQFYRIENNIKKLYFYIRSDNESLTFNLESNDNIVQFIPIYLKTIKGLIVKYYTPGQNQFEVGVLDDVNIDDVLKTITKEDFNLKLNTNKYNI